MIIIPSSFTGRSVVAFLYCVILRTCNITTGIHCPIPIRPLFDLLVPPLLQIYTGTALRAQGTPDPPLGRAS